MFLKNRNYLEECSRNTVWYISSLTPVAAPGGNRANVPPPETPKICKEWGTVHASASNENNSWKIFKFSLNFSEILLKFS